MTVYEICRQACQDLNNLIDDLIKNEPFWGHGKDYELNMYTTRQILEKLTPLEKTLSKYYVE